MITVDKLTVQYGQHVAIHDISFTCQPGRVTGFLGPNGSGKSTTLRAIVGLQAPTSGSATLWGQPYAQLPNPARQVGILLDASAFHPGITGQQTLRIAADALGVGAPRVQEVLDLVGLTRAEAKKTVKQYSLGMRQRLGIAYALLGKPAALILDEPANGLDPTGVRWMRDLLREQANAGMTVLLSSHLLHEIELIADDIVVLGGGKLLASGHKQALLDRAQGNLEDWFVDLTADQSREQLQR